MSVAWKVLAVADLKPFLVSEQVEALNSSSLGTGQNPRFDDAMPHVAARVRNKIASCSRNQLSATANSVPPEMVMHTALLIIEALQPGLGITLTEDQKAQIETAKEDLNRVAECKDVVSEPSDPLTPGPAQTGGYVKVVSAATRGATHEKMAGI